MLAARLDRHDDQLRPVLPGIEPGTAKAPSVAVTCIPASATIRSSSSAKYHRSAYSRVISRSTHADRTTLIRSTKYCVRADHDRPRR